MDGNGEMGLLILIVDHSISPYQAQVRHRDSELKLSLGKHQAGITKKKISFFPDEPLKNPLICDWLCWDYSPSRTKMEHHTFGAISHWYIAMVHG